MKKSFWKKILAAAVTALVCSGFADEVKLLTYNIHACIGLDKKMDPARIAEVIRKTGADTVALQEVDKMTKRTNSDQAAVIAKALGYHHLFGKAIDRQGGEYGNAVVSRYPLELIDNFTIPRKHEKRCVLVVKVLAPRPYYVLATHFDHTKQAEDFRVKCAQIIKEYLEKNPQCRPAFLMGDLNSLFQSKPIRALRDAGFRFFNDCDPAMLSFPAGKPKGDPKWLLDYIALWQGEKAELKSCYVVNEPVASDHRPVFAHLVLPQEDAGEMKK